MEEEFVEVAEKKDDRFVYHVVKDLLIAAVCFGIAWYLNWEQATPIWNFFMN